MFENSSLIIDSVKGSRHKSRNIKSNSMFVFPNIESLSPRLCILIFFNQATCIRISDGVLPQVIVLNVIPTYVF